MFFHFSEKLFLCFSTGEKITIGTYVPTAKSFLHLQHLLTSPAFSARTLLATSAGDRDGYAIGVPSLNNIITMLPLANKEIRRLEVSLQLQGESWRSIDPGGAIGKTLERNLHRRTPKVKWQKRPLNLSPLMTLASQRAACQGFGDSSSRGRKA